jgi:hypothetical protein
MEIMRTYNTIEDMNAVAKEQWREYARMVCDNIQELGATVAEDEALAEFANIQISIWDEDGDYPEELTMEMESWARGSLDGIEAEIEILDQTTPEPMPEGVKLAMAQILADKFDLTTIATWMQESIPETLTQMQEAVLGKLPDDGECSDDELTAFNNAFWQAICKANVI